MKTTKDEILNPQKENEISIFVCVNQDVTQEGI